MRAIVCLLIPLFACEASDDANTPTTPTSPTAEMSGKRPREMRNCPTAVAGSVTRLVPTADGVMLTITAKDAKVRREIVERMQRSGASGARRADVPPHSGRGGGPERMGFCPIIYGDTIVTSMIVDDSVQVLMKARDPAGVGQLQRMVGDRVRAIATAPSS